MLFDRRKITELRALYEFEPTVRDVFVEGVSDRRLMSILLGELGCRQVSVRDIDQVEIEPELLKSYGLSKGQRQRVVALAYELSTHQASVDGGATCVIDRDLDNFSVAPIAPILMRTDPSSVEGYVLRGETLARFLTLLLELDTEAAAIIGKSVISIANATFACRVMHRRRYPTVKFPEVDRAITINRELLAAFDEEKWLGKWRQAVAFSAAISSVVTELAELRSELNIPCADYVHKDDLRHLLRMLINTTYGAGSVRGENIGGTIQLAFQSHLLRQEKLFSSLQMRLTLSAAETG